MMDKKADCREVCLAPAECFNPAPKVDSIVIAFDLNEKFSEIKDEDFLNFIKIAFKEPRKKMIKNLSSDYEKCTLQKIFIEL
jgi:16S rRNA (adenine1518-N6/adenine1519-N6)-dimethyltransferase